MEPTVSRRAFVKCASLGALAVSAAAVAGCSADSAPEKLADSSGESISHNPSRTESCDIVVVGSGMAGICAGARAADLGAHVIVLEQNSSLGGTSTVAEGVAGVNSYIHVRDGIEINVNEAVNRVEEYCHWGANKDVLTRLASRHLRRAVRGGDEFSRLVPGLAFAVRRGRKTGYDRPRRHRASGSIYRGSRW